MTTTLILAKENRVMINGIQKDIRDIKSSIGKLFTKTDEVTNHLSNRLPTWATITITLLGMVVTGLIVAFVT